MLSNLHVTTATFNRTQVLLEVLTFVYAARNFASFFFLFNNFFPDGPKAIEEEQAKQQQIPLARSYVPL